MTDYPKRLRACVTASRGIDCRDPDLLIGAADEIDWLKAENTRLNDAKRRALAIADERSRENVALRAALDRYRYVYAWWTADGHDSGGEFRSRMHWARGEDYHHLTNDEIAAIGQRFLACTGRHRRRACGYPLLESRAQGQQENKP